MALKLGLKVEIRTDSDPVLSWVNSVIRKNRIIRAKGVAEMIVKCRLRIPGELLNEFGLKLEAVFVPLERNKADIMT